MAGQNDNHIIWIDTELTGIDIDTCTILEVACLITDANLNIISDAFEIIIHQPDEILNNMNEWCIENHKKTGLTEASRSSKISIEEADQTLLKFLQKYVPKGVCPLAGNTIYMDKIFLQKCMPLVAEYVHYRVIDVSSIKELVRRWNPILFKKQPQKKLAHRALDDIKESIGELKYYKDNVFKCLMD